MEKTQEQIQEELQQMRASEERYRSRYKSESTVTRASSMFPEKKELSLAEILDRQNQGKRRERVQVFKYDAMRTMIWRSMKQVAFEFDYEVMVTNELKALMPDLINYFACREEGELDPKKGLFLWGPPGVGKTMLMQALQKVYRATNHVRRFKVSPCPDVYENVANNQGRIHEWYYQENRCFDDLGAEPPNYKNFGNTINPMERILQKRYDRGRERGIITHVTSNLRFFRTEDMNPNLPVLEDRFDERLVSRAKEMFNFVCLTGPDLRES